MGAVRVGVASWDRQGAALRAIREAVFVEEQRVPRELEMDADDAAATHFLLSEGGRHLACGRLLPDGKIGRMAVLRAHRSRGLGRQLLDCIIRHARRQGMARLYLHAQQDAIGFYQRAGFARYGKPFEEAGIPHAAMQLQIK